MNEFPSQLASDLADEEYRYVYDETIANSLVASQIRRIRIDRGLSQAELAELAGMRQSSIARIEDVNYSAWSVRTLRRVAQALGVRLSVRFESWGDLVSDISQLGPADLSVPRFDEDPLILQLLGNRLPTGTMMDDTEEFASSSAP